MLLVISDFFNELNNNKLLKFGETFFYLGTLFLPWAFPISAIFFLISISISIKYQGLNFFRDYWNLPLYICSGIMIISSIKAYFSIPIKELEFWDKSSALLYLFNWIPFFFLFKAAELYVKEISQRKLFAKILILSTIPVLLSCILQYYFNIYGPFKFLLGLIVWYQKPLEQLGGVSGLFNNPNYAGMWLSASLPFSFFLFRSNRKKIISLIFVCLYIFLTIHFVSLTNSRNSLLGIFIASFFMFGQKMLFVSVGILFISYLIFLISNNFTIFNFNEFLRLIIPENISNKIFSFSSLNSYKFIRFEIWEKSLLIISRRPFLGWGAATFTTLYLTMKGDSNSLHTHSLPLEIAHISGIPAAIILTTFVTFIFIKAFNKVFRDNKKPPNIDRAWLASTLIIIVSHLTDITYYDGKISILIWILLSGIKKISLN